MPVVTGGKRKAVIQRRLDIGVMLGVMAVGEIIAQRAKKVASDKGVVDTGRLARSIHRGPPMRSELYTWHVSIGTNVEYARAHEMGSGLYSEDPAFRKKYKITAGMLNFFNTKSPNPKWALSFKWPGGPDPHPALTTTGPYAGHYTFASVMHPGVKPRPYLRPALEDVLTDGTARRVTLNAIMAQVRM